MGVMVGVREGVGVWVCVGVGVEVRVEVGVAVSVGVAVLVREGSVVGVEFSSEDAILSGVAPVVSETAWISTGT